MSTVAGRVSLRTALLAAAVLMVLMAGYTMRQQSLAVVSVQYSATAQEPIEDLYIFLGERKRWTPVLAPGGRVRETFAGGGGGPVVVLLRIGSERYEWAGDAAEHGERILLQVQPSGTFAASRCHWPCRPSRVGVCRLSAGPPLAWLDAAPAASTRPGSPLGAMDQRGPLLDIGALHLGPLMARCGR